MRLTTKGRYAVTAMLDLTLHGEHCPVSLADISKRQQISLSYLEQLFSKLKQAKLVKSIRGPGGGYVLERIASQIPVSEIIDAVNESVDATHCKGAGNCQQGDVCLTHHLWSDLSEQIRSFLKGISLANLVERRDVIEVALRQDQDNPGSLSELQAYSGESSAEMPQSDTVDPDRPEQRISASNI